MNNLLPKVNEDVCISLTEEYKDVEKFIATLTKRMVEENPVIVSYLSAYIGQMPLCCSNATLVGAMVVYRMLEIQAEVNKMEKEIIL